MQKYLIQDSAQFRLGFRFIMSHSISNKILTSHVLEDAKLKKALEVYVEVGSRDVICVSKFDNKDVVMVSSRIGEKLETKPHLVDALLELFENSDEEELSEQRLVSNKELHLPKLFAPFKDKSRGWKDQAVKEQAILYMNYLGYGHGGKSLIDTQFKNAEKPDWFSTKLTFGQYEGR